MVRHEILRGVMAENIGDEKPKVDDGVESELGVGGSGTRTDGWDTRMCQTEGVFKGLQTQSLEPER